MKTHAEPTRTLVIVPTVDEAANIEVLCRRVREAAPWAHLLVVDGASTDATREIVAAMATELGGIDLLVQATRNGIGGAYRAGFEWGLSAGFEILVEMDADLSHDPADLPALIAAAADGARLAIGSRYVPGGSTPTWPRRRRLLSTAGNRYVNAMLGLGVSDATAGFRAYRASTLREVGADRSEANGYTFQVEMAYLVARTGVASSSSP